MKSWKKGLAIAGGVLVIAAVCIIGYFEIRFPVTEVAATLEGREKILRREPAAEITDEDRILLDGLWSCPSSQDVTESSDLILEEHPDLMEMINSHLNRETVSSLYVSVFVMEDHRSLDLQWSEGENREIYLQYSKSDSEEHYLKTVVLPSFRSGNKPKYLYQNIDNEDWKRFERRRRWFGYIRDLIWEE